MLIDIYTEFKSFFIDSKSKNKKEEFELLESKHTRIRFDYDIYEMIRIF